MNIASTSSTLHAWAVSLHPNEVSLIGTFVGAIATMITAIVAVLIAFKQLSRQFEHKVLYEGWNDFQKKLFDFSNTLTDYSSTIQWLPYMIDSQNNSLVNGGNKSKYRQQKWQELSDSFMLHQQAYIAFLRSFETHEVVFISLDKMMKTFQKEYREKVGDVNMAFMEKVFPEMYGSKKTYTEKELKDAINKYWQDLTDIQIYLDDFRVELQNATIGKVLNKSVKGRVISKDYKKLTKRGLK